MKPLRITAHTTIFRPAGDVIVELTGSYYHARDRDDCEIEDIVAHDAAGNVIDLDEEEIDRAIELLFVQADEEMMSRAIDRAELRRKWNE